MPRIPDVKLERLKKDVSLERLVEQAGVKLKRHGKDLIGLCPFRDDNEPSLVISPDENLWHCLGACQACDPPNKGRIKGARIKGTLPGTLPFG